MGSRLGKINRKTKETEVSVMVNIDGTGKIDVKTGINFLDHLILSFGKHSMMDLIIKSKSKDGIAHHLIEDVGIALGNAIDLALGERKNITRFGHASVPMDESLSEVSIDLVKRPYQKVDLAIQRNQVEGISKEDLEHFFDSFSKNLNCCVHISVSYGKNDHHKIESAMKALAIAWRMASNPDKKQKGIPSTKGAM